jgi:hypothetical protein
MRIGFLNCAGGKKYFGKLKVCISFCNLKRVTPKYEYCTHIANILINNVSEIELLVFLTGMSDIIKSLWPKKMLPKWSLYVPALLVCSSGSSCHLS